MAKAIHTYSQEMVDKICGRLMEGESLRKICRDDAMPQKTTILKWLREHPDFQKQYAMAREIQADTLADELLDIADNTEVGEVVETRADGKEIVRREDMLGHRRLKYDARRWYIAKIHPTKYGDKTDVNISGKLSLEAWVLDSLGEPQKADEPKS